MAIFHCVVHRHYNIVTALFISVIQSVDSVEFLNITCLLFISLYIAAASTPFSISYGSIKKYVQITVIT